MPRKAYFPTTWAALPDSVAEWRSAYLEGRDLYDQADADIARQSIEQPAISSKNVAVVEVTGPLTKRPGFLSSVGMVQIGAALERLAANPSVAAIVLSFDSPGGTVDGTPQLARTVREINQRVPIVAYADGMMASAAYRIGSQASKIICSENALIGSIGTLAIHADYSVMLENAGIKVSILRADASTKKAEGNPVEPLTDEARARITRQLNRMNNGFIADVKQARGELDDEVFTGAAWLAEDAPAGMHDGIGTINDAIAIAADLAAEQSKPLQSTQLTNPPTSMTETIKTVRAAFAGKPFLSDALGMAADGKTEAEIWQAYAETCDARIEAMAAEHAKEIEQIKSEHAQAIEKQSADFEAALKEANDRADKAEAKLKAGGWSPAEAGSRGGTAQTRAGITITRIS